MSELALQTGTHGTRETQYTILASSEELRVLSPKSSGCVPRTHLSPCATRADWVEQQLRALSAVEPPGGLKEEMLAAIPRRAVVGPPWRMWRWPRATGWAGLAAMIVVFCGVIWFRTATGPSVNSSADANAGLGPVLAADYNSVRPADINAFDSNGLY